MHPFDRVMVDGKTAGVSTWIGYSSNEGKMLTLAVLDAEYAEPGTEVDVRVGRAGRRLRKPTVERHMQTQMRAIVSPVPYVEVVRKAYAPGGWQRRSRRQGYLWHGGDERRLGDERAQFHLPAISRSTQTGTWSDGLSQERTWRSMPASTSRSAACGDSSRWSMRMPSSLAQAPAW